MVDETKLETSEGQPSFIISPKHDNAWLVEKAKETNNRLNGIADDVIANARELTPSVNWHDILTITTWHGVNRPVYGKFAVQRRVAGAIGNMARIMSWNMDNPAVVYMSGAVFVKVLNEKLESLGYVLETLKKGESLLDEEARNIRISEREAESGKFGVFRARIIKSLEQYATSHLPMAGNPAYLELLRKIPFTGHDSMAKEKGKAIRAFKNGDLTTALEQINASLKRRSDSMWR